MIASRKAYRGDRWAMAIMSNAVFRMLVMGSSLLLSSRLALSQDQTSAPPTAASQPSAAQNPLAATAVGTIRGIVKSGNTPIPGAAVSVSLGRNLFRCDFGLRSLLRAGPNGRICQQFAAGCGGSVPLDRASEF